MNLSRQICPYTLRPLSSIPEVSAEHIFPHAIGGSLDFSVIVDRTTNCRLGSTRDAAFVDSDIIRGLRTQQGISSRSGPPEWNVAGETQKAKRPVITTFRPNKKPTVRYTKPFTLDSITGERHIFGTQEQVARLSDETTRSMREKGIPITSIRFESVPREQILPQFKADEKCILRGLIKVVFLAAYHYLGDTWLNDPLFLSLRDVVLKEDPNAIDTPIYGRPFRRMKMFDHLARHEHGVAIFNLPQINPILPGGIYGAVSLFGAYRGSQGTDPLASVFLIARSHFDRKPGEGVITICNAKLRQSQTSPLLLQP